MSSDFSQLQDPQIRAQLSEMLAQNFPNPQESDITEIFGGGVQDAGELFQRATPIPSPGFERNIDPAAAQVTPLRPSEPFDFEALIEAFGGLGGTGATGPAGEIGATGEVGPMGLTGDIGAAGPIGPSGLAGTTNIPAPIVPPPIQPVSPPAQPAPAPLIPAPVPAPAPLPAPTPVVTTSPSPEVSPTPSVTIPFPFPFPFPSTTPPAPVTGPSTIGTEDRTSPGGITIPGPVSIPGVIGPGVREGGTAAPPGTPTSTTRGAPTSTGGAVPPEPPFLTGDTLRVETVVLSNAGTQQDVDLITGIYSATFNSTYWAAINNGDTVEEAQNKAQAAGETILQQQVAVLSPSPAPIRSGSGGGGDAIRGGSDSGVSTGIGSISGAGIGLSGQVSIEEIETGKRRK